MKKNYVLIAIALVSPLAGFAQNNSEEKSPTLKQEAPRYNNRMAVFGPLHQVYERTKPNAFYSGLEAWMYFFKKNESEFKRGKLLNVEMRYGYNFLFGKKDYFTPFLGVTYVQNLKTHDNYEWAFLGNNQWEKVNTSVRNSGLLFGAVGFYYDHEFSSIFDLGLKVKGLLGGKVSKHNPGLEAPVSGFDIALPITFRFGPNRHWDYRIEPFSLSFWGANGGYESYFGFRNTIGYRF